jgi:hypothetical protein
LITAKRPHMANGVASTGEGKLARKATGYEQKKPKPRYATSGSRLREPSFRRPLERIGDPQISSTRLNSKAFCYRPEVLKRGSGFLRKI